MLDIYDYMMEDCYNPENCDGLRGYFYRRHAAFVDYAYDEEVESERLKQDNQKEADKKPQQRNLREQDEYDAIEDQARRDLEDMERHVRRHFIMEGYLPGCMDMDY